MKNVFHAEAVVCVKIETEDEMDALCAAATAANIPSYIVLDAGRTQVEPGSKTVLAIGPGM